MKTPLKIRYDNYNSNWSSWCREDYNSNGCGSEIKGGGVRVGGVVSREIRTNNVRTGFEFIDLATNDRDILAFITGNGPRVGKYYVNLSGCRFAAERLINALVRGHHL